MPTLLIVESPKKAKTIQPIVGPDFTVLASFGHVADLPEDRLGINTSTIDIEYVPLEHKAAQLRRIQVAA